MPSCKKLLAPYKGEYELSGRVIDDISGKPIPNATVGVLEYNKDDFSGWGAKTAVSGLTDDKGAFSFRFNVDKAKYYYEFVAQEPYKYFDISNYPRIEIDRKGKSTMDIKLMPKGYLTLHVKGNKGGYRWGGGGHSSQYKGVDTLLTSYECPNQITRMTYEVDNINNEVIEKTTLEIFIPTPPDTAFYLIEF